MIFEQVLAFLPGFFSVFWSTKNGENTEKCHKNMSEDNDNIDRGSYESHNIPKRNKRCKHLLFDYHGVCQDCNYICPHKFAKIDGQCTRCKFSCVYKTKHGDHWFENGECAYCGHICIHKESLKKDDYICSECDSELRHNWFYEKGVDGDCTTYYGECINCSQQCITHDFCVERCRQCEFECEHPRVSRKTNRCVICDTRIYD